MKLAKQIITLTAALVLMMGVAFTLISGIVIFGQTGAGAERRVVNTAHSQATRIVRDAHTFRVAEASRLYAIDGAGTITAEERDARVEAADNVRRADLRRLDNMRDRNLNALRAGTATQTLTATPLNVNNELTSAMTNFNATVLGAYSTVPNTTGSTRNRWLRAFTTERTTVRSEGDIVIQNVTASRQVLTPMGKLFVTGLASTFIGAGLLLTVKCLNKQEAEAGTPAAKPAKA